MAESALGERMIVDGIIEHVPDGLTKWLAWRVARAAVKAIFCETDVVKLLHFGVYWMWSRALLSYDHIEHERVMKAIDRLTRAVRH